MIEYKDLISKRKPHGFFTKANKEDSIKATISWYLFICKVKNNNKPLSQKQLCKLNEGSLAQNFSMFKIAKNDLDQEHFGEVIQKEWYSRDFVIEYYTKKAKKFGRPLLPEEMDCNLKSAFTRYNIVKKELDYEIFGFSNLFYWDRELKKDPNYIIKQLKMIWDFYGRSPIIAEIDLYCEEKDMPYTGRALLSALRRVHNLKKTDIDKKFGTPPSNSYLVEICNKKYIIVKSLGEVYITNILIGYGLEFDYEGLIDDGQSYLYDFKLPDSKGEPIYIEYFGLNRDRAHGHKSYSNMVKKYLKRESKKKNLYKKNKLKLIFMDGDFFDGNDINKFQKQFYSLLKDNNIKVGKFKALCLEDLSKSKHDFKWDANKVEQEIKEILEEAGGFVSESDLRRMGRFDILNAVRVHHPLRSILRVAEKLGYKDDRPSGGITGRPPKDWMPFKKARSFARSLNLRSVEEWDLYWREGIVGLPPKPEDIPNAARQVYPEWVSIYDWLGYDPIQYASFEDAKKFAKSLGLKAVNEWVDYCKGELSHLPPKPDNIPNSLQHMKETLYKDEFTTSGDFLGIITFTYDQSKDFAISLGLKSLKEWNSYCMGKMPNLPPRPYYIKQRIDEVYLNKGWTNWGDFLGYRNQFQNWLPYEEAREFVTGLSLKSYKEWNLYKKGQILHLPEIPNDIPKAPHLTYKNKGWKTVGDWLGYKVAKPKINKKFPQQQLEL